MRKAFIIFRFTKRSDKRDERAERMLAELTAEMAKREGVTEALKAYDQMEWVQRINSIRSRAEEVVYSEVIYAI